MHKLLKTMLLWMLLLALPLPGFVLAGGLACGAASAAHGVHVAHMMTHAPAPQSCAAVGGAHAGDAGHQDDHAACHACTACCPAATAFLPSSAVPACEAQGGPIAYASAYLSHLIAAPPEPPPRHFFL